MNEQPTPETDALCERLMPYAEGITIDNVTERIRLFLAELCALSTKLERERDAARAERDAFHDRLSSEWAVAIERDQLRSELDTLRAQSQANDVALLGAVRKAHDEAQKIKAICWGWDGDGGSTSYAEEIIDQLTPFIPVKP